MRAPTPHRDLRRPAAVVVALLLALATLALGARAGAQTPETTTPGAAPPPAGSVPGTEPAESTSTTLPPPPASQAPFPAPFVAPIPPVTGPPQLIAADIYVTQSEDPTSPDVVVRFKGPFTLPPGTYRVAVVVGDPLGTRMRATLVSKDKVTSGEIEVEDANGRRALGPTTALFDPSGIVVVRVPLGSAPSGDAVWVEITDNPGTVPDAVSPLFSRTAVFGGAEPGALPSSQFGWSATPGAAAGRAEPVAIPAGPVVSVVNAGITLDYREPAPAELLGQPVTEVVDSLQIAPNFDDGAVVTDFVRLNRTDGSIGLYDGNAPAPIDVSGDRAWVGQGLPTPSTASGTVVLDLAGISTLLGFTPDPDRTALGVSRSFTLADGRIITAGPTLATLGWFESAAPPPATVPVEPPASTGASSTTDQNRLLFAGIGAAVLVLLVVLIVVAVRRRRSDDIDWIARAAAEEGATPGPEDTYEPEASPEPASPPAPVPAPAPEPAPAPAPEPESEPVPVAEPVEPVEPVVSVEGGEPVEPAAPAESALGPEPTVEPTVEPERPVVVAPESPVTGELQWASDVAAEPPAEPDEPSDPLAALAALDDDLAALRSRLGLDRDDPAPGG